MEESKTVSINLDARSIDILRKVDVIHRDSVLNVALALVEKTGYYKTLSGTSDKDSGLDDVASLDVISDTSTSTTSTSTKSNKSSGPEASKKAATSWDAF